MITATTSETIVPTAAVQPDSLTGATAASSPKANGAQSRTSIMHVLRFASSRTWGFRRSESSALQEEVEAQPGEAGDQEEGIGTHVSRLCAADPRAGAADHVDSRHDQTLDDVALEDRVRPAADGEGRADEERVDRLVEVPLVLEEIVEPAEAADQLGRDAGPGDVHPVRDRDPPERDDRADQQAEPGGAVRGDLIRKPRAGECGVEEVLDDVVHARDL